MIEDRVSNYVSSLGILPIVPDRIPPENSFCDFSRGFTKDSLGNTKDFFPEFSTGWFLQKFLLGFSSSYCNITLGMSSRIPPWNHPGISADINLVVSGISSGKCLLKFLQGYLQGLLRQHLHLQRFICSDFSKNFQLRLFQKKSNQYTWGPNRNFKCDSPRHSTRLFFRSFARNTSSYTSKNFSGNLYRNSIRNFFGDSFGSSSRDVPCISPWDANVDSYNENF